MACGLRPGLRARACGLAAVQELVSIIRVYSKVSFSYFNLSSLTAPQFGVEDLGCLFLCLGLRIQGAEDCCWFLRYV